MNENNPPHEHEDNAAEEPKSLSLMGGIVTQDEIPAADDDTAFSELKSQRAVSQGTILILGLIVLGGLSLYAMRAFQDDLTVDAGSEEVNLRIEQTLAKLDDPDSLAEDDPLRTGNMDALLGDTDHIVRMFAVDYSDQRVPLEYVQQNPFNLTDPSAAEQTPQDDGPDEAERRAAMERQVDQLDLQSVMRGRMPIAVINGEFLREGEQIGAFTISEISPHQLRVTLEHTEEGETFELDMRSAP